MVKTVPYRLDNRTNKQSVTSRGSELPNSFLCIQQLFSDQVNKTFVLLFEFLHESTYICIFENQLMLFFVCGEVNISSI